MASNAFSNRTSFNGTSSPSILAATLAPSAKATASFIAVFDAQRLVSHDPRREHEHEDQASARAPNTEE